MKNKNQKFLFLSLLFLVLFITLSANPLLARPGGGHSYSGGGGGGYSGGGGGGDGIGILIYLLFELLPPYISIPLVIGIFIYARWSEKKNKGRKSIVSSPTSASRSQTALAIGQQIGGLLKKDPNFSRVLFLDFVSSLYTKHKSYSYDEKQLKTLSPFFDKKILEQVPKHKATVNEIVIGAMNILQIAETNEATHVLVEINANYTVTINDKSTKHIVTEKWQFTRAANVQSLVPERMQKLACPSCGAAANFNDAGNCEYCGNTVAPGQQQWMVTNKVTTYTDTVKANSLLSYAPEEGTNLPTIYSPTVDNEKLQFAAAHNTTWEQYWSVFYHNISSKYFMEIYKHWSDLTWNETRHLLTDRLWESYNFWIDEYKRYGLQNKLDDTQIKTILPVKIEMDKFYEAVTVRIFASSKDYVIDQQGKVKAGNARSPRVFSEYWTFVRRKGVENDSYDMKTCPNCGAPADKVNQGGHCEYCSTKISNGDFSWVLSFITQDEEYIG